MIHMTPPNQGNDAYAPAEIALRVEEIGVKKASLGTFTLLALAVLAGAFIALGAVFFTVVQTGSNLGFGPARLLAAVPFCLGLVLVLVGGGELFTGNVLLTMAWASRRIALRLLLRNWILAYVGNFVGALSIAALVAMAQTAKLSAGAVGVTMATLAHAKLDLTFGQALARGVLCNLLVCLAVWLCFGARTVTDKVVAVILPVSAFVACGFEHCVANMYLVPVAIWSQADLPASAARLSWLVFLQDNLLPVTLGNIVGGTLVAAVYWAVYLRGKGPASPADGQSTPETPRAVVP